MTPKQEAFARAYVETGNASEAYRTAYDAKNMQENTIWKRASELLQHGEVAGRVAQLHARAQKRNDITVDSLTEMAKKAFEEAQRIAPTTGQMQTSAMVKAAEFLAKLHGLIVDKSEVTHKNGVEDADDSELEHIALAGRGRATSPPAGSSRSN